MADDDLVPQGRPPIIRAEDPTAEIQRDVERAAQRQAAWAFAIACQRELTEHEARALTEMMRALAIAGQVYRIAHGIPEP